MNILAVYFSGTGNTYYCAQYIKKHMECSKTTVRTASIESLPAADVLDCDALIVGFPVYACDVPDIMKQYLVQIPPAQGKPAYLFCTDGFYSGNALRRAANLLESVGFYVVGWADVTMPGSDALAFLKKDSPAARKLCNRDFVHMTALDRLMEEIRLDCVDKRRPIAAIRDRQVPTKPLGALAGGIFRLGFPPIKRYMMGQYYADDNCVRCGYCEKICPASNIRVTEQGVHFGNDCLLCMRCVHQCPQEAIQIGQRTVGKLRWKGPDGKFHPPALTRRKSQQ